MNGNDKTPGCTGACQCVECCLICRCKDTIGTPQIQPPKMGMALRFYLKRYSAELFPLAKSGDKVASRIIDGCNNILIESNRLEGGYYGR